MSPPVRRLAPPLLMLLGLLTAHGVMDAWAGEESAAIPGDEPGAVSFSDAGDPQLRELINVLLDRNPEIQSARADARSMAQRAPQAGSLPDPSLTYRYFALSPETRVGPQEHALELSQGIPWKGKRGLQAERAEHGAMSRAWRARDLERMLVADLKRTYFRAAYLQEALEINREEHDLLQRFERIALRRYATGEGIQQSVVKVQTDITRLGDRETGLQEQLDSVTRRIAELIARPESELKLERIRLDLPPVSYDRAALEAQAVARHPRVLAIREKIASDSAWARRRKLESRPDFRFGLGYTVVGDREDMAGLASPPEDNGQDSLAFMVGLSIPIYGGRIDAGVEEARESVVAGEQLQVSTANRLRTLVQESDLELKSLEERARLYQEVLIPQAGEALGSAEAAYTTGRQGFLDLLDAERVLFQVRLTHRSLVSSYWTALAEMEFAVASPFPAAGRETGAGGGERQAAEGSR